jgi:hypothetical protein
MAFSDNIWQLVSVTCWGHEIGQKTPERHLGLCKRPKNRAGPCP